MAERDRRNGASSWRSRGSKSSSRKAFNNNNNNNNNNRAAEAEEPPRLSELQYQNRVKTRRFFLKKKPPQVMSSSINSSNINNNSGGGGSSSSTPVAVQAPHAPRNTTSFIMRAKTSGGIAPIVSPVTPACASTPDMSRAASYREGIVEEVNKEWGLDGYGSMNGLIRLRSSSDEGAKDESGSDSDMELHSVQQLEQRLDHDLNRFEIVGFGEDNRALQQQQQHSLPESRIAHLEEENLTLKERIFILEQQVEELKQQLRLQGRGGIDEMEVCSAGDASSAGQH